MMDLKHLRLNFGEDRTSQAQAGFVLGFLLVAFGMLVGILCLGFVSAGDLYDFQDSFESRNFASGNPGVLSSPGQPTAYGQRLPELDVIICLAGGRGRIAAAAELWFRYFRARVDHQKKSGPPPKVPYLYLSGVGPRSEWSTLHKTLREEIRNKLTDEYVILEKESGNTVENALFFLDEARPRKWNQFLVVTSSYHMRRSHFIFEKILDHPRSGLASNVILTRALHQEPFTKKKWKTDVNSIYVTLYEYLKWVYFKTFWLPSSDFLRR